LIVIFLWKRGAAVSVEAASHPTATKANALERPAGPLGKNATL
jgi:hypothetical protein